MMGYAFVDLDRIRVDSSALETIPGSLAHQYRIIPVKKQDSTLYLALNNPRDLAALDDAALSASCRIIPVLATKEAIEQALQRYYPKKTEG